MADDLITVRAWLRTGKIKGVKVGGTVLVDRTSLNNLVKPMGKNGDSDAQIQA